MLRQRIHVSQTYTERVSGFHIFMIQPVNSKSDLAYFTQLFCSTKQFQGGLQLTWNTREEMGRRIPKWEMLETRCTLPDTPNCPDSDEDGISDFFDLCPVYAVRLLMIFQDDDGCPEYGVAANIDQIYTEIYRDETLVYQSQEIGSQAYEDKRLIQN